MPDLHVSAQLLSALPPVTSAQAIPADPAAPGGAPDAFAAVLAGKLLPVPPAAPLPGAMMAAQPPLDPAASPTVEDTAPADPLATKDPKADREAKDAPAPVEAAPGASPDAAAQLLATLGALAPVAQPAAPSRPAGPQAESGTNGIASKPGRAAPGPGAGSGKSAASLPTDASKEAPVHTTDQDAAPSVAAVSAVASHGTGGESRAAEATQTVVMQPETPQAPHVTTTATTTVSAPAPSIHMTVPGPVGTPLWREEFAASVNLLATQKVSSAELRVQPAELGPVQVSIRIESGEANITCAAQHADTRHALESALPRLREMLESNGISVGSASVGAHPQNTGTGGDPAWGAPAGQARPAAGTPAPHEDPAAFQSAQASRAYARSDRLLDVFA